MPFLSSSSPRAGSLLFELLIGVAIITVIITISAQAVYVSLISNKKSGEKDQAVAILKETIDATRAVTESRWQDLYALSKGGTHYYPTLSNGAWTLVAGDEVINGTNAQFTRYVTIDNVSRDTTTRAIETAYNASRDDAGTQKITAVVTWGGNTLSASEYVFRWQNRICLQTGWTSTGSGVKTCPDTTYETSVNIMSTGGTSIELCPSGC